MTNPTPNSPSDNMADLASSHEVNPHEENDKNDEQVDGITSTQSHTKAAGKYHHGNLKHELVCTYLTLLTKIPADKISLRKLASEVGVAATAVYNHFSNKDELIAAVKEECLEDFIKHLNSLPLESLNARQRICALARAYYQYSLDNPEYFNMIFYELVPDEFFTEALVEKCTRAESTLRATVLIILEENNLPTSQYNLGLGVFSVWSMVHGVTTLAAKHVNYAACIKDRWPPEFMLNDRDSINQSFEAIANVLVAGIIEAVNKESR